MATTHCFAPVLGKRLRITELDTCGAVLDAATEDAMLVTDGFISVTMTAETEDGTEIITRKADGSLCVNEKMADSFKRLTVEIEFCGVNPALLAMVTNAEVYLDYNSEVAGFTIGEGAIEKTFALELWTGLAGQACVEGAEDASGYLLLPFLNAGILGDLTVDGENAVTFTLSGAYTKGGNAWGVGPYDVVLDDTSAAAPLPTALDSGDHLLLIDTALAPPASACDAQPMPTAA